MKENSTNLASWSKFGGLILGYTENHTSANPQSSTKTKTMLGFTGGGTLTAPENEVLKLIA